MRERGIYIYIYMVKLKFIKWNPPWAVQLPGVCFWLFHFTSVVLIVVFELSNLCFTLKAKGKLKSIPPQKRNGWFEPLEYFWHWSNCGPCVSLLAFCFYISNVLLLVICLSIDLHVVVVLPLPGVFCPNLYSIKCIRGLVFEVEKTPRE